MSVRRFYLRSKRAFSTDADAQRPRASRAAVWAFRDRAAPARGADGKHTAGRRAAAGGIRRRRRDADATPSGQGDARRRVGALVGALAREATVAAARGQLGDLDLRIEPPAVLRGRPRSRVNRLGEDGVAARLLASASAEEGGDLMASHEGALRLVIAGADHRPTVGLIKTLVQLAGERPELGLGSTVPLDPAGRDVREVAEEAISALVTSAARPSERAARRDEERAQHEPANHSTNSSESSRMNISARSVSGPV